MPNKRDLSLQQFGISPNRYRELRAFCLQYQEFKDARRDYYELSGSAMTGMPHGGGVSNPTGRNAEEAYKISKNIDMIESTAIEAAGAYHKHMLEAVSKGLNWNHIKDLCRDKCPYTRADFDDDRRHYFYILNLKK